MHIDRLFAFAIGCALLAATATATATAAEPDPQDKPASLTAQRDAAVVYIKQRSFYITRMAGRCRKVLDMPASPAEEPETSTWYTDNYRYNKATAIYASKRRSADVLQAYQQTLAATREIQQQAYDKADRDLRSSDDRTVHCQQFFADSKARKFDITPQDPQYEVLEGMAQEFVR